MFVLLDEPVFNAKDVRALGILNGDFISVDPRCQFTDNGYIKSRFIDDKAAIACCLTIIKYLKENNLKPKYKTVFAFPTARKSVWAVLMCRKVFPNILHSILD